MIASDLNIPGYTEYDFSSKPSIDSNKIDGHNKIILLASNVLSDDHIFCNGLHQNIINFYKMFESMGYCPLMMYDEKPDPQKIKNYISHYKYVLPETIIESSLSIYALLEIGMTIPSSVRQYLNTFGTKIIKVSLGNTLNIDIEISTKLSEVDFTHNIGGNYNLLLTSPHYKQNLDYIAGINNTSFTKSKIAPYVWDSTILNIAIKLLNENKNISNSLEWGGKKNILQHLEPWQQRDIVIMEPNLGFQKCFYVPLMIAAAFSRKVPEWKGNIVIYNMQSTFRNSNFEKNIFPLLGFESSRLKIKGRYSIVDIMKNNQNGIFIHHQVNNEYNYMFFELMSRGFPILHNVNLWKEYGYYYSVWDEDEKDNNDVCPFKQLYRIFHEHEYNIEKYNAQFAKLSWSHSIYNPDIQSKWNELIEE